MKEEKDIVTRKRSKERLCEILKKENEEIGLKKETKEIS
jgi:hypothetical protein